MERLFSLSRAKTKSATMQKKITSDNDIYYHFVKSDRFAEFKKRRAHIFKSLNEIAKNVQSKNLNIKWRKPDDYTKFMKVYVNHMYYKALSVRLNERYSFPGDSMLSNFMSEYIIYCDLCVEHFSAILATVTTEVDYELIEKNKHLEKEVSKCNLRIDENSRHLTDILDSDPLFKKNLAYNDLLIELTQLKDDVIALTEHYSLAPSIGGGISNKVMLKLNANIYEDFDVGIEVIKNWVKECNEYVKRNELAIKQSEIINKNTSLSVKFKELSCDVKNVSTRIDNLNMKCSEQKLWSYHDEYLKNRNIYNFIKNICDGDYHEISEFSSIQKNAPKKVTDIISQIKADDERRKLAQAGISSVGEVLCFHEPDDKQPYTNDRKAQVCTGFSFKGGENILALIKDMVTENEKLWVDIISQSPVYKFINCGLQEKDDISKRIDRELSLSKLDRQENEFMKVSYRFINTSMSGRMKSCIGFFSDIRDIILGVQSEFRQPGLLTCNDTNIRETIGLCFLMTPYRIECFYQAVLIKAISFYYKNGQDFNCIGRYYTAINNNGVLADIMDCITKDNSILKYNDDFSDVLDVRLSAQNSMLFLTELTDDVKVSGTVDNVMGVPPKYTKHGKVKKDIIYDQRTFSNVRSQGVDDAGIININISIS
ncbi:hypothetical protein [Lelliottia wanjuensis]|uniref:hypothetical protein n=1 Tax=Lelliottia wanjuensis TaxID=3050585 RepID=UPI00254C5EAC|nr:hypothetical protein [Lelliottia sp. V104_15]MDK9605819.1 hypothetical protein [Lelliottia sp. V104_15]